VAIIGNLFCVRNRAGEPWKAFAVSGRCNGETVGGERE